MKSTMKKLLSLMLVAILLVSAVPFQAAAATTDTLTVKIYIDGEYEVTKDYIMNEDSVTLTQAVAETLFDTTEKDFDYWANKDGNKCDGAKITKTGLANVDDDYHVKLYITRKDKKGDETPTPEVEHKAATVRVQVWVDDEKYGDKEHEFTIAANGSQKLDEALAKTVVKSDKEFVKWTGYDGHTATNETITADAVNERLKSTPDYHVNLYVKKQEETTKPSETVEPITVKIVDGSGNAIANQFEVTPANGKSAVVQDILSARWNKNWADSYTFQNASTENDKTMSLTDSANAGETLTIVLAEKEETISKYDLEVGYGKANIKLILNMNYENGGKKLVRINNSSLKFGEIMDAIDKAGLIPTRTYYNFDGWYWKAECNSSAKVLVNDYVRGDDVTEVEFFAKWTRKSNAPTTLLKIYINDDTSCEDLVVDVSEFTLEDDYRFDIFELKKVLKVYYTYSAYDGLYSADTWKTDFNTYNPKKGADYIDVSENDKTTSIFVMLHDAKRVKTTTTTTSTSKADSSNPKTGDQIYVAVTILAVSAAALAAVYYVSKKREAR